MYISANYNTTVLHKHWVQGLQWRIQDLKAGGADSGGAKRGRKILIINIH